MSIIARLSFVILSFRIANALQLNKLFEDPQFQVPDQASRMSRTTKRLEELMRDPAFKKIHSHISMDKLKSKMMELDHPAREYIQQKPNVSLANFLKTEAGSKCAPCEACVPAGDPFGCMYGSGCPYCGPIYLCMATCIPKTKFLETCGYFPDDVFSGKATGIPAAGIRGIPTAATKAFDVPHTVPGYRIKGDGGPPGVPSPCDWETVAKLRREFFGLSPPTHKHKHKKTKKKKTSDQQAATASEADDEAILEAAEQEFEAAAAATASEADAVAQPDIGF